MARAVGLDIGARHVRLVEVEGSGRGLRVLRLGERDCVVPEGVDREEAVREAVDALFRDTRASRDEDDETSRVENELSDGETPDAVLASKQIATAVNLAIEALSDELRQAITLREIEGLSYEEIAEVMNCPIGTVRSRIFRAREAISAKVKPMLENQSGKRW